MSYRGKSGGLGNSRTARDGDEPITDLVGIHHRDVCLGGVWVWGQYERDLSNEPGGLTGQQSVSVSGHSGAARGGDADAPHTRAGSLVKAVALGRLDRQAEVVSGVQYGA